MKHIRYFKPLVSRLCKLRMNQRVWKYIQCMTYIHPCKWYYFTLFTIISKLQVKFFREILKLQQAQNSTLWLLADKRFIQYVFCTTTISYRFWWVVEQILRQKFRDFTSSPIRRLTIQCSFLTGSGPGITSSQNTNNRNIRKLDDFESCPEGKQRLKSFVPRGPFY